MGKGVLIEDISLRDKEKVIKDRKEAGIFLAEKLLAYRGTDSIILSIPSGGVPVAREVAVFLQLPMDLIIVRKIQIPFNTEAGFGAMGPSGEIVFNESLLKHLHLSKEEIEGANLHYADLSKMLDIYHPNSLVEGYNKLPKAGEFFFISNPAPYASSGPLPT